MGVHFKENEEKITLGMIISGIVVIGILLTTLIVYLLNVSHSNVVGEDREIQQIGEKVEEQDDEFETVSIDMGKRVNEVENNSEIENKENNTNLNTTSNLNNTVTENITLNTSNKNNKEKLDNTENDSKELVDTTSQIENKKEKEEPQEDLKFIAPIKGEIIREFAPDSLVYSETLEEWITHNGVDVKADKTSVVTASADGTIYAIKNDPRYGLTVIIEHDGGYKTIYANLLTAEYVVEGEHVQSGQTIGTVGNSAVFEIADDYHLHFEILKDGDYLNPTDYMDF